MITFPLPISRPLVVFTDLDGTLIDHHTYDAEQCREALQKLARRAAPVVFCSSKTFEEQVNLQRKLGMCQPFIFENGSAAAIPAGFFPVNSYVATQEEQGFEVVVFAHAGALELQALLSLFQDIRGYAAASDVELAAATGLRGEALQRARSRWFTETLLTQMDAAGAERLNDALRSNGFSLSRGGRFYTVQSMKVNKGRAVQWMMDLFRGAPSSEKTCFAAVGDSPNDAPMLEVVEAPFLVQRPNQTWAAMDIPQLIKIEGIGPAGFSMAIQMLLGA